MHLLHIYALYTRKSVAMPFGPISRMMLLFCCQMGGFGKVLRITNCCGFTTLIRRRFHAVYLYIEKCRRRARRVCHIIKLAAILCVGAWPIQIAYTMRQPTLSRAPSEMKFLYAVVLFCFFFTELFYSKYS